MKICVTKNGARNQLACFRANGTRELAVLGPSLPHHDLAHYVVERKFGICRGFFGNIEQGYSVAQLSEKEVIRGLGPESWTAEVLARGLQSLYSGACEAAQLQELVNAELALWKIPAVNVSVGDAETMAVEFTGLLERFSSLLDGESMELEFELAGSSLAGLHPNT